MIFRFTSYFIVCMAALLALFSLPSTLHALTVENVTFTDSVTINGTPVPVNDAALQR